MSTLKRCDSVRLNYEQLEDRHMLAADPLIFDADQVGWSSLRNATSTQFSDYFDSVKSDNIILDIEIDEINGVESLAGVWQRNTDNRGWAEHRNLDSSKFHDLWTKYSDDGFRLIDQEAYTLNGSQLYAGIWIENVEGYKWASYRNVTSQEFSDRFQEYKDGFVMLDIDAYDLNGSTRYSAIWVEDVKDMAWVERRDLTSEQFSEYFDQYKNDYRVLDIESYELNGSQRYAAIWVENTNERSWIERRDMSATSYRNHWYRYRDLGYRLINFEKYQNVNGQTRYAGVWRQNSDRPDWPLRGEFDEVVDGFRAATDIPGIGVAIAHHGEIQYMRGFGHQDIADDVWYSARTINRLASVSKAVGGVLAMQLVEQGVLDLDTLTVEYVRGLSRAQNGHTPRQLLSVRSGVGHYTQLGLGEENGIYATAAQASQLIDEQPLLFRPGVGCHYSTHGYTLLGAAMEGATGMPIVDVVEANITTGLNLPTLRAEDMNTNDSNEATMYQGDNSEYKPNDNSWKVLGGGLESSPYDLVRFGMQLIEGQILSQQSLDELWTPPSPTPCVGAFDGRTHSNFALGWVTGSSMQMTGSWQGTLAHIRIYPEDDIVIVLLSNRKQNNDLAGLGFDLGQRILNAEPLQVAGDVNNDFVVNAQDIEMMYDAIATGVGAAVFDLNNDGEKDALDLRVLVEDVLGTNFGDANLDGKVDAVDLNVVGLNWRREDARVGWSDGDFDGNNRINSADLNQLALHWLEGPHPTRVSQSPLAVATSSASASMSASPSTDGVDSVHSQPTRMSEDLPNRVTRRPRNETAVARGMRSVSAERVDQSESIVDQLFSKSDWKTHSV